MPTIELTGTTFQRLQKFATPLVDTPDSALSKVLDLLESKSPAETDGAGATSKAPDLSHTKITGAKIAGRSLAPALCNWNAVMIAMAHEAAKHLPEGRTLADLLSVNFVDGRREDSGYKFQEDLGLSIQGQDSNSAWRASAALAASTGISVEVNFEWYEHPKAARPGQSAKLSA